MKLGKLICRKKDFQTFSTFILGCFVSNFERNNRDYSKEVVFNGVNVVSLLSTLGRELGPSSFSQLNLVKVLEKIMKKFTEN